MRECAEDRDEEEALDDWFIESLKTYTDLHVYQLEHATRVLEWTSGRTVCVAGFSSSKNEILELSLPLRLLAEQNKGLCAERDFKVVHGGFSEAPIHSLKHIPGTRLGSPLFDVCFLISSFSDVIRRTGQIDIKCESLRGAEWGRGRKMAAPPSRCSEPKILHGATTNDVQLTDINTTKQLYRIQACAVSEPLSCLQFLSEGVFVCGSVNGSVLEVDSRSPAPPTCHPAPLPSDSTAWSMDVCGGGLVVRSRASGHTVVSDLRKMDSRLAQAQVTASDGKNRGSLNVTWAPALQHHIALSGVNGLVQIYNTSLWGAELQPAHAQFEHRGHVVSSHEDDVITTSHAWHPERPRTLLSAASDASVHVWDWNHQSESSK
uniref:WD repeat domain 73 n=1 Tax=Periophthalmus magnuspinnatus TaxID=409849 RepID=A0A3B4AZQ4_9GOBI